MLASNDPKDWRDTLIFLFLSMHVEADCCSQPQCSLFFVWGNSAQLSYRCDTRIHIVWAMAQSQLGTDLTECREWLWKEMEETNVKIWLTGKRRAANSVWAPQALRPKRPIIGQLCPRIRSKCLETGMLYWILAHNGIPSFSLFLWRMSRLLVTPTNDACSCESSTVQLANRCVTHTHTQTH